MKQISVTGSFGIFDLVISSNIDEKITMTYDLNGFSKTNILRILNDLLNSDYLVVDQIPYLIVGSVITLGTR